MKKRTKESVLTSALRVYKEILSGKRTQEPKLLIRSILAGAMVANVPGGLYVGEPMKATKKGFKHSNNNSVAKSAVQVRALAC